MAMPTYTTDQIANYLINGYWHDQSSSAHKFADPNITVDLSELTAGAQALARAALGTWEDVSGLRFSEVSSGAQITFDDNQSGAWSSSSWSGGAIITSHVNVSTNWLASYGTAIDSYSFQTYVHEIGHAIGLGHTGNYNGSASYGVDNTFSNDTWSYSIMSYFDQAEAGFGSYRYVLGPQIADIVAAQSLYGGNSATRAGNTTYGHNANAGDLYSFANYSKAPAFAIHDGGGVDTLDASGYGHNQVISLVAETFSSIGGLTNNISIGRGSVIENAVGGSGNDTIVANSATNELQGGAGSDTVSYWASSGAVTIDLASQTASGGDAAGDSISGFENATGGMAADRLIGSTSANTLNGGGGGDIMVAGGGSDVLNGGAGNDYMYGGTGTNNVLSGEDGVDILISEGSYDWMHGGDGGDYFYTFAGASNPVAYGGEGNDISVDLSGHGTHDVFQGEAGQDYFYGFGGNDAFYGGEGVDVALLGEGADYFVGGAGVDYAWGAGGNDTYRMTAANGHLVLNDFAAGGSEDQIVLAGTVLASLSSVKAATTYYAGMNTSILTIDADTSIWFIGIHESSLTSADFIF